MNHTLRIIYGAIILLPIGLTGQNVRGTVSAADSGLPIADATVLAVQQIASAKQKPVIYKVQTDETGRYGIYLDPCQWGGAPTVLVTAGPPLSVPLNLSPGVKFVLRVHDDKRLLRKTETLRGESLAVSVAGYGPFTPILPIIYDDELIRDYGAVVPLNAPMKVVVIAKNGAVLADHAGAPLSAQGVSFQASAQAPKLSPQAVPLPHMFRPSTATVVHVFTGGSR